MDNWKILAVDQLIMKNGLTKKKAIQWIDTFYNSVIIELQMAYKISSKDQRTTGYYPINLRSLRNKIRFSYKNKQIDLVEELDLIKIVVLGSNHSRRRTLVSTIIPIDNILKINGHDDIIEYWYAGYEDFDYEEVRVDNESLQNYIENTRALIKSNSCLNKERLTEYLFKAKSLLMVSQSYGFVPHVINESSFGRRYYKSLNLQNVPAVIREAALGNVISIDIEASIFRWKYLEVKRIDSSIKMPETMEYVEERKEFHRNRLIDVVFGNNDKLDHKFKYGIIKQAITAIGFGAKVKDTSFWGAPALREMFTPKNSKIVMTEQLQNFITDDFVSKFILEQEKISDIIYQHNKEKFKEDSELYEKVRSGRGIEKSKVLAYLYQHAERDLMDPIYETYGEKIALKIHDGFYIRDINNEEILNIKEYFNRNGYSVIFNTNSSFVRTSLLKEQRNEEDHHKKLIAITEMIAKGFIQADIKDIDIDSFTNKELGITNKFSKYKKNHNGNALGYTGSVYDKELDPFADINQ